MREAVLDVGSNTAHLLVVDAHRGAPPLPASSTKQALRLAEHLTPEGALSDEGVDSLITFIRVALEEAEDQGCESVMAFATSAIREASNTDDVLSTVLDETGVELIVLTGDDEAKLTFLAVRRWFGWSSGRLAVFDIGGGSLEIAVGSDESPDVAQSLPLGAGRLTREHLAHGLDRDVVRELRKRIRADIASDAGSVLRHAPDHAVATSKTFRSLARICGAASSEAGLLVRRVLDASVPRETIPRLLEMTPDEVAELPGVSSSRAHQIVAGALVADAVLDLFDLAELEICPWALREGIILERLDLLA